MNVDSVNGASADLTQILMMANQQQTALAEKLMKVGVQNTINENQLATMGNLIDTYA